MSFFTKLSWVVTYSKQLLTINSHDRLMSFIDPSNSLRPQTGLGYDLLPEAPNIKATARNTPVYILF